MNEPIQEGKPIYVFQLPIRIWHWSMVLSFLVLIPTGYIIGKPWHSLDGDPTYLFYMGYTRMAHFIAGFIIAIGLLWRIIFAFFGNKYSRQVFIIPFWRKSWWLDLLSDFRWYLFLDRTPREHIGHNPLAQLGMMTCINLLIIMILTGFGMYVQSSDSVILQPFHLVVDFIYWIGDSVSDFIHLADITDPVHIEMVQRHSSAVILLDDREGRAVYRLRDSESLSKALRKNCFPDAKIAVCSGRDLW